MSVSFFGLSYSDGQRPPKRFCDMRHFRHVSQLTVTANMLRSASYLSGSDVISVSNAVFSSVRIEVQLP